MLYVASDKKCKKKNSHEVLAFVLSGWLDIENRFNKVLSVLNMFYDTRNRKSRRCHKTKRNRTVSEAHSFRSGPSSLCEWEKPMSVDGPRGEYYSSRARTAYVTGALGSDGLPEHRTVILPMEAIMRKAFPRFPVWCYR